MSPACVVFIPGFRSRADTWSPFLRLLRGDVELTGIVLHAFRYRSPLVSLHPLRRIPTIDDVASSLRTFLSRDLAGCSRVGLVSHSQGGLVVQRLLARLLADGAGPELSRIRLVVMFACPNAGSGLLLGPRRRARLWRNAQEPELRPFHEAVLAAQRTVLHRLVYADRRPLHLVAYAGESDGVVPPASARSVFPDTGTLPGDHFSIIRPASRTDRAYLALKHDLLTHLLAPGPPAAGGPDPALPDLAGPATGEQDGLVVDQLLAVPGMTEPRFRQRLYRQLPDRVREQLPHHDVTRLELIGVVAVLTDYQHLAAWDSLLRGVRSLVPDHPAVTELAATLARLGLIGH